MDPYRFRFIWRISLLTQFYRRLSIPCCYLDSDPFIWVNLFLVPKWLIIYIVEGVWSIAFLFRCVWVWYGRVGQRSYYQVRLVGRSKVFLWLLLVKLCLVETYLINSNRKYEVGYFRFYSFITVFNAVVVQGHRARQVAEIKYFHILISSLW